MLNASIAQSNHLSPGPRVTETLPTPAAAAGVAAMMKAPPRLVPVQDLKAATRARGVRTRAERPQVQVSCSTGGPIPTAPASYEGLSHFYGWFV